MKKNFRTLLAMIAALALAFVGLSAASGSMASRSWLRKPPYQACATVKRLSRLSSSIL